MDYNNMNKRASRSYNPNTQSRGQNPRANQNVARPATQRPTTQRPTTQRPAAQRPVAQRPAAQRPATQRPISRSPQKNAPKRPVPPKQTAPKRSSPPKKQPAKRDWVYPEGFNPQKPPQNRTPQRRPAPNQNYNRRPAPKKEPAIKIKIDWQRVGAVCLAVLIRFVCAVVVVSIAFSVYFRINFYSKPTPPTDEVVYNFITVTGEGDNAEKTTNSILIDAYSAYDRNDLLISFSEISKWLGTAQVGDIYSMRFVLGQDNVSETVVFHNSSQDAFVNGNPIAMRCRAQFRHGEVWVPVSFVRDYITGIEIEEKKDSVSVSLNGEELSFTLAPIDPLQPVPVLEDTE